MARKIWVALGLCGFLGWGEFVHWRASRAEVGARPGARSEAVVVLGFRNGRGARANALNRWRVRAALRSIDRTVGNSILICSGGSGAGAVTEAALLARYAVVERGFAGPVQLEDRSRSTWQNVENLIPLIEHVDQIKFVSNSLHAQKARLYLRHQRPDLAARVVRAADYRLGEAFPLKPLFALYGLRDLIRAKHSLAEQQRRQMPAVP